MKRRHRSWGVVAAILVVGASACGGGGSTPEAKTKDRTTTTSVSSATTESSPCLDAAQLIQQGANYASAGATSAAQQPIAGRQAAALVPSLDAAISDCYEQGVDPGCREQLALGRQIIGVIATNYSKLDQVDEVTAIGLVAETDSRVKELLDQMKPYAGACRAYYAGG